MVRTVLAGIKNNNATTLSPGPQFFPLVYSNICGAVEALCSYAKGVKKMRTTRPGNSYNENFGGFTFPKFDGTTITV